MNASIERSSGSTRAAGIAALYLGTAYVAGIVYFVFGLDYPGIVEPVQKIALFEANLLGLQLAHLGLYVVFGFSLMFLAWALHARLHQASPIATRMATGVGLVWGGLLIAVGLVTNAGMELAVTLASADLEQAVTTWLAIEAVTTGLGGGNGEVLGGFWTLLMSAVAWQARALPRTLCAIGVGAGIVGLSSALPGLAVLTGIFALGQLVWFVWLGIVLLRSPRVRRSEAVLHDL